MMFAPAKPTLEQQLYTDLGSMLLAKAGIPMGTLSGASLPAEMTTWQGWLSTCFSDYFTSPFAPHHEDFWQHVWEIKPDVRPRPYIAVWPRGGGKSSSTELAVIMLGAHGQRKYALYLSGTQSQADKHVESIGDMLEYPAFAARYPMFGSRKVSRYGHSKGWRRNRLTTSSGYTIDAAGLENAVRGIKRERSRLDVLVLDDLDDVTDGPSVIARKMTLLTKSVLPAGSRDVAIIGVQNLIHPDSIFSKLVERKVDFLIDREMNGPIPAIENMTYELRDNKYFVTSGRATWEGQSLEICQAMMKDMGLTAFLGEAQHETELTTAGMYGHIEFAHCEWSAVPMLERIVVWVDPAVTNTDDSDSHGIQADGLGVDKKLYRLFSWEGRTSPEDVLKRAIEKAIELKAECVGVETDQGGDTWMSTYRLAAQDMGVTPPRFRAAKAGQGHGPKAHRQAQMLADYERGRIVHVIGTHQALERALKRFGVRKPFDLADSAYWAWFDLCGQRHRFAPVGT